MAIKISRGDTLEQLAYTLLGDTRLTHEVFIPGWNPNLPLPEGQIAYIRGNPIGPPSKNWTRPARSPRGQ